MVIKRWPLALVATLCFVTGCEIPGEPDFKTEPVIEVPVLFDLEYQLIGNGDVQNVLIDTTSGDGIDTLFTIQSDDGLLITREENFDFGDLNDAIPEVDVDPTAFDAAVGELEIGSFASEGTDELGRASFVSITGQDPNIVPVGTPIPGGSNAASPVIINIGASTDFFASATIKSGELLLGIRNDLGFDISSLTISLLSDGVQVGSNAVFNNLTTGSSAAEGITFSDGDRLANLTVRVVVAWDPFLFPAETGDLVVTSAEGNDLIASQVQAAVESQTFETNGSASFDSTEFVFRDPSHFVELEAGSIALTGLENGIEIALDTLVIEFQSILCPVSPGSPTLQPLVLDYLLGEGDGIPAASGGNPGLANDQVQDLAGCRIQALNNEVTYTVEAITENTQNAPAGSQIRTLSEDDGVAASVSISGLAISSATGIVKRQDVLLNDDDGANGTNVLDLFNDNEAEITTIDGIDDLSENLEGIEFADPSLTISYVTNIRIPTTIYGAFVGTNTRGEEVYLRGLNGSMNEVLPSETDLIAGLFSNGRQLNENETIKFSISTDGSNTPIVFDPTTTNVDEFLNALPDNIRFVGRAVINQDEEAASISTPLEFDPVILVDLPIFLSLDNAQLTDTLEEDLSDVFPDPDDEEISFEEANLIINFTNGLPLSFNASFTFLDENRDSLTSIPASPSEDPILVQANTIDAMGFGNPIDQATQGSFSVRLTSEQSDLLNAARFVTLNVDLNSTRANEIAQDVRLRFNDKIRVSLVARINAVVTVD
ncbi:MAG: hypothetical protein AAFW89_07590 [Bacteroidota bacterium]